MKLLNRLRLNIALIISFDIYYANKARNPIKSALINAFTSSIPFFSIIPKK